MVPEVRIHSVNRVIRVPADAQQVGFEWVVLGEPGFTLKMSEIGGQCPGGED